MHNSGFSLLELLTSLAFISLVTLVSIPKWTPLIQQHRATASVNQLLGAVAFTRSSAINHRVTTTLCPLAPSSVRDFVDRTPTCGRRNTWEQGALVFVDHNRNGQLDGADRLLQQLPGWQHGAKLYWRAFRSRSFLQFNPRGHTNWQNGSFVYCPADGNLRYARRVVLNSAGRAYRAIDRTGDNIDEASDHRGLRC